MKTVVLIYNGDEISHFQTDIIPEWGDNYLIDEAKYFVKERWLSINPDAPIRLVVDIITDEE